MQAEACPLCVHAVAHCCFQAINTQLDTRLASAQEAADAAAAQAKQATQVLKDYLKQSHGNCGMLVMLVHSKCKRHRG
jgi:hypothetical protein